MNKQMSMKNPFGATTFIRLARANTPSSGAEEPEPLMTPEERTEAHLTNVPSLQEVKKVLGNVSRRTQDPNLQAQLATFMEQIEQIQVALLEFAKVDITTKEAPVAAPSQITPEMIGGRPAQQKEVVKPASK